MHALMLFIMRMHGSSGILCNVFPIDSKATSLINSVNNVSDEQNIADMWQEHFRKLYNSCSNTSCCIVHSTQVTFVRWQNAESVSFSIANGVRQGAILSPFLFCLYIRDLIGSIASFHLGCNVAGTMINLLCLRMICMLFLTPSWAWFTYIDI